MVDDLPPELVLTLMPVLETIGEISRGIRDYDWQIETLSKERDPETEFLRQVDGVGPLSTLCFRLTIEEPTRFKKSRASSHTEGAWGVA